jgi:polysaccharide deacetylase 2 family uncharacterized protein YibQ
LAIRAWAGEQAHRPAAGVSHRLAWRLLGLFWAVWLTSGAALIGTLAWLGPPSPVAAQAGLVAGMAPPAAAPPTLPVRPRVAGAAIAPPNPALLEPSPDVALGQLPRIGADGSAPAQIYAAGFDRSDQRPRVALLIAGIGMNEAESGVAVANLPASVSLAISPYAPRLEALLAQARAAGHELLVSLPLEPQAYPLNDPGHHALLTGASLAVNAQRLDWALTRFGGYVGATGALGDLRGERFAAAPDQMEPVLDTLARRGLLYVDPRPNARRFGAMRPSRGAYRGIDLVVDDPPGQEAVDAALARLERVAVNRGAAIGLVGRPAPLTLDRIGVWLLGLEARGVALAPVSVVVQMPQAPSTTLSLRGPP